MVLTMTIIDMVKCAKWVAKMVMPFVAVVKSLLIIVALVFNHFLVIGIKAAVCRKN